MPANQKLQDNGVSLPGYNIRKIIGVRDEIINEVFYSCVHGFVSGDSYENLVLDILKRLPSGIEYHTVYQSLRDLVDVELTPELVKAAAWRMSGSFAFLKEGQIIGPWQNQPSPEWVPIHITRSYPELNYRKEYGTRVEATILAGRPAGLTISEFWSGSKTAMRAKHIGFNRKKFLYSKPQELTNMRYYVWLEAEHCRNGQPGYWSVRCPSSCMEHNRRILKLRARLDGERCPKNYHHHCYQCHIGYKQCPGSTHRDTYEIAYCHGCNQQAYFDPEDHSDVCTRCSHKRRLSRK